MKLNEITDEIRAKLYAAETLDDFMKVAEDCGVEVTRQQAVRFYSGARVSISDDQLAPVAGGAGLETGIGTCPHCGYNYTRAELYSWPTRESDSGCGSSATEYQCSNCGGWF